MKRILAATLTAAAWPAYALAPAEVYAKVSPSVWRVQTYDADGVPLGQGSGVVVQREAVVTNCHVLAKAKRVAVLHDKLKLDAKLERWDAPRDVCELKVAGLAAPAVVVLHADKVEVGQPVYAIGNPKGLDLTMSSGLVSSLRRDDEGRVKLIQTSAAISGGSSGGGLFDDQGRLIGLTTIGSVTGDAQNLNFAVPADWISELPARHAKLNATKVAVATASAPRDTKTGAAVRADADVDGALRRGDELEYTVTDRFTGTSRRVVYRVDRVEADTIVFNNGARTESTRGELLGIASPIGGDMELMEPPQGWAGSSLAPGNRWRAQFKGRHPSLEISYDLNAVVLDEAPLHTEAGDFNAVRIAYTGWSQILSGIQQQVTLDVWIDTKTRRIVRFSSDVKKASAGFYMNVSSRETAELTGIRRY